MRRSVEKRKTDGSSGAVKNESGKRKRGQGKGKIQPYLHFSTPLERQFTYRDFPADSRSASALEEEDRVYAERFGGGDVSEVYSAPRSVSEQRSKASRHHYSPSTLLGPPRSVQSALRQQRRDLAINFNPESTRSETATEDSSFVAVSLAGGGDSSRRTVVVSEVDEELGGPERLDSMSDVEPDLVDDHATQFEEEEAELLTEERMLDARSERAPLLSQVPRESLEGLDEPGWTDSPVEKKGILGVLGRWIIIFSNNRIVRSTFDSLYSLIARSFWLICLSFFVVALALLIVFVRPILLDRFCSPYEECGSFALGYKIIVFVDDHSGLPLQDVAVTTLNRVEFLSDEKGAVLFFEPGLMNVPLYLTASVDGYESAILQLNSTQATSACVSLHSVGDEDSVRVSSNVGILNGSGRDDSGPEPAVYFFRDCSPRGSLCSSSGLSSSISSSLVRLRSSTSKGMCRPSPSAFFGLQVVDADTQRGIPLVRVGADDDPYSVDWTDSSGFYAFRHAPQMNSDVRFSFMSPDYEPIDGQQLFAQEGMIIVVPMTRLSSIPAVRCQRITGGGVFGMTELLGAANPPGILTDTANMNAGVVAAQTMQCIEHIHKIFCFWRDAVLYYENLVLNATHGGVMAGVTIPAESTYLEKGTSFVYFRGPDEFIKSMISGVAIHYDSAYVDGLVSFLISDEAPASAKVRGTKAKTEKMYGFYRLQSPEIGTQPAKVERGFVVFNEAELVFDYLQPSMGNAALFDQIDELELLSPLYSFEEDNYLYFGRPFPLARVRPSEVSFVNESDYEFFSPLKDGGRLGSPHVDLPYRWKRNTSPVDPVAQMVLEIRGKLKVGAGLFQILDLVSGARLVIRSGSLCFNVPRMRYVFVGEALGVTGVVYYGESDSIMGPWLFAQPVASHEWEGFNDVSILPTGCREMLIFSGSLKAENSSAYGYVPRYTMNSLTYGLNVSSPLLRHPRPVAGRIIQSEVIDLFDGNVTTGVSIVAEDVVPPSDALPLLFFGGEESDEATVPLYRCYAPSSHRWDLTIMEDDSSLVREDEEKWPGRAAAVESPDYAKECVVVCPVYADQRWPSLVPLFRYKNDTTWLYGLNGPETIGSMVRDQRPIAWTWYSVRRVFASAVP